MACRNSNIEKVSTCKNSLPLRGVMGTRMF